MDENELAGILNEVSHLNRQEESIENHNNQHSQSVDVNEENIVNEENTANIEEEPVIEVD